MHTAATSNYINIDSSNLCPTLQYLRGTRELGFGSGRDPKLYPITRHLFSPFKGEHCRFDGLFSVSLAFTFMSPHSEHNAFFIWASLMEVVRWPLIHWKRAELQLRPIFTLARRLFAPQISIEDMGHNTAVQNVVRHDVDGSEDT